MLVFFYNHSSVRSQAPPSLPSSWTVVFMPENGSLLPSASGLSKRYKIANWYFKCTKRQNYYSKCCCCPQALSTYGSDAQMTSLLDQMDVYVLPVFNIDGYDFTHKSVCFMSMLCSYCLGHLFFIFLFDRVNAVIAPIQSLQPMCYSTYRVCS